MKYMFYQKKRGNSKMSDLISRKSLIDQIKIANNRSSLGETVNGFNLSGIEIVGIIKDEPAARDVVNVVLQDIIDKLEIIRERRQYDAERSLHNGNEFMEYGYNCEILGIDKAIFEIKSKMVKITT